MNNDDFEWDPVKAEANVRKHGIDFDDAQRVFDDPFVLFEYDGSGGDVEDRFLATGLVDGRMITVVHTERGERIRIVSARKANSHEQREYNRGTAPP